MEFAKEKEVCLPARVNHWREADILPTSLNNNTRATQGLQISQGSGNPYYGQRTHVAGEFNRETGWTSLTRLFCTHEMTEVVDVESILQRSHQRAHCWKTAAYKSGAGSLYSENSSRRKISVCRNQFEILMMSSLFPPLLKPTPASWSAVTAAQTLRIRKGARESLFCSGAPCKSSTTIFERFCEGLQSVTVYFDIVSRNIRWAIV